MTTELHIDMEQCCGHGRCYVLFPELFAADEVGDPRVLKPTLEESDFADARMAVAACPEQAISLTEVQDG